MPTCSSPETILIIDDSPDNLNLLNEMLSQAGYKVYLAPSGNLAMQFIQSKIPDLILLDIMMPHLDGYAICEQLKASPKSHDIPIIFISALHEVCDKIRAFSLGGVDYITKPFQEQEVLIRIENQLRLRRLSKQLIEQNIIEERNRMAREIHDSLAQAFTGIIIHLGAAEREIVTDPQQARSHIQIGRELAKMGLTEARRSVEALRPKLLEEGDLYSALHRLATQMSLYSETRTVFEVVGAPYPLPLEVENHLLRIGQEALTNAVKYAEATLIEMQLVYQKVRVILEVRDNGKGFNPDHLFQSDRFGVLGMKERAQRLGADLTVNSQEGKGTEVIVSLSCESVGLQL